jgi:hypothetical protein
MAAELVSMSREEIDRLDLICPLRRAVFVCVNAKPAPALAIDEL